MTVAVALPEKGSFRAWLLAARPRTLAAAFVPVAVGTACAYRSGGLAWLPALAALLGACLLQIGTNLANDVFDYEKGADTEDRLGPPRAAQSGLLSVSALKAGVAVVFGLALLSGLYLVSVAGPVILAIGLTSIAAGIAYTGGPYPLAYHGLGDVFVVVFFGFVAVMGTELVQTHHVSVLSALASVPVGALATNILVVNNVRDRVGDASVGKRTLIVRFGRAFGEAEYVACLVAAYAIPVLLVALGHSGVAVLLPFVTLPLAIRLALRLRREDGETLNGVLAGTAGVMMCFGLTFAIGLALSR